MDSFRAELLALRKRTSTWVLFVVPNMMSLFFGYVLPYSAYLSGSEDNGVPVQLADLLPASVLPNVLGGIPFYMGMVALILGVMAAGGDYGWGTLKTTLVQRPSRIRLLGAKVAALGVVVVVFTVSAFVVGAVSSSVIAALEGESAEWPGVLDVGRALGVGWLLLLLWALFGVMLATITRGTALAVGLGILYGLVIEGVVSGFGSDIGVLRDLSQVFLRTNAYSLVEPLDAVVAEGGEPGAFAGPFVNVWQALAMVLAYMVAFTGVSALLLKRRDVA